MTDCPECGQENYGSPPGPLTKKLRALEAELAGVRADWQGAQKAYQDEEARVRELETCYECEPCPTHKAERFNAKLREAKA